MTNRISTLDCFPVTLGKIQSQNILRREITSLSSVKIDNAPFADYIFSGMKGELIFCTALNLACVVNERVKWSIPINRFESLIRYAPNQSKIICWDKGTLGLIDVDTGSKEREIPHVEPISELLVGENSFFSLSKTTGRVCSYDFELKEKWSYSLGEGNDSLRLVKMKDSLVVISSGRIVILDEEGVLLENPFPELLDKGPIRTVFKTPDNKLFVGWGSNAQVLDFQNGTSLALSLQEGLNGTPVVLSDGNNGWSGFVCALDPSYIKHGIYDYRIGIYPKHGGECKVIVDEFPLHYLLADGNNTIIALFGPPREVYNNFESCMEGLSYYIRFFSADGQEIGKISFDREEFPMLGPLVITPEGYLAGFSKGRLWFLNGAPAAFPPLDRINV